MSIDPKLLELMNKNIEGELSVSLVLRNSELALSLFREDIAWASAESGCNVSYIKEFPSLYAVSITAPVPLLKLLLSSPSIEVATKNE